MATLNLTPTTDTFVFTLTSSLAGSYTRNGGVAVGFADIDTFITGSGNDTFNWRSFGQTQAIDAGSGTDTFSVAGSISPWNINLSAGLAQADATFIDLLGFENATGNDANNTITGNAAANVLIGGGGFDTLRYTSSPAGVTVNLSANTVSGGDAQGDTISGFEAVIGSNHADDLQAFNGAYSLSGGSGNDALQVGNGVFTVDGGNDTDTLILAADLPVHAGSTLSGGNASDILQIAFIAAGTMDLRSVNLAGLEVLRYQANVNGDLQINATQFAANFTSVISTLSGGGQIISIFMDTATAFSLAGVGFFLFDTSDDRVVITGDGDAETITGSSATDTINGNGGNDLIEGGANADSLDGGVGGFDTVSYAGSTSGVTVRLDNNTASGGHAQGDTISGFEAVVGSNHADTLQAFFGTFSISGGGGNDTIQVGAGVFTVDGGNDDDVIVVLSDQPANAGSSLAGGGGTDVLRAGFFGTGTMDLRAVTLTGFETLAYQATINGDLQINAAQFAANFTSVTSTLAGGNQVISIFMDTATAFSLMGVSFSDFSGANDRVVITGDGDAETITGSAVKDEIHGNGGTDFLIGDAGDDQLLGGAGADILFHGEGADLFNGGSEIDYVTYAAAANVVAIYLADQNLNAYSAQGDTYVDVEAFFLSGHNDSFIGDASNNFVFGQGGDDFIIGGGGGDIIFGEGGNDFIQSGALGDLLSGGAGNDTFAYTINQIEQDQILDFSVGEDKLAFDRVGFNLVNQQPFAGINFISTTSGVGASYGAGQSVLIYFSDLGLLYADTDGAGGAAANLIAALAGTPALTASDFLFI